MGLFGSKYRYKPSDYSNWQMDPMAIDRQDLRGSGGATGGGMIRGDTAVQKEYQPNLREGGNRIDGRDALSLILASVSDAMARNRGYEANASDNVWAPRMNAMQMAREAQAAQQARAAKLEDYDATKQIDQRYAEPPKPDQLTQYMINAGIDPNSEQARKMFGQAVQNKVNPPVWRQGDDGRYYRMETGDPPAFTDEDWNSGQPLSVGGGVGNGTSGFRSAPPRFRR